MSREKNGEVFNQLKVSKNNFEGNKKPPATLGTGGMKKKT